MANNQNPANNLFNEAFNEELTKIQKQYEILENLCNNFSNNVQNSFAEKIETLKKEAMDKIQKNLESWLKNPVFLYFLLQQ